jgi:hypothetical protein
VLLRQGPAGKPWGSFSCSGELLGLKMKARWGEKDKTTKEKQREKRSTNTNSGTASITVQKKVFLNLLKNLRF